MVHSTTGFPGIVVQTPVQTSAKPPCADAYTQSRTISPVRSTTALFGDGLAERGEASPTSP